VCTQEIPCVYTRGLLCVHKNPGVQTRNLLCAHRSSPARTLHTTDVLGRSLVFIEEISLARTQEISCAHTRNLLCAHRRSLASTQDISCVHTGFLMCSPQMPKSRVPTRQDLSCACNEISDLHTRDLFTLRDATAVTC
jgi:hypothetical protein